MTHFDESNDTYDVFFSYARHDGPAAQKIVEKLRHRGLSVWFDETDIDAFAGISDKIRDGISRSKLFVPLWSQTYLTRRACQAELITAYISAQSACGDPRKHFAIVNPENSHEHIVPVDLRDTLNSAAFAEELVEKLVERAQSLANSIGTLDQQSASFVVGQRRLGSERFVGRIRPMLQIHGLLNASRFDMAGMDPGSDVAVLEGLGGTGKSLLAESYANTFACAYPGGVIWLNAHGDDADRQGWSESFRHKSIEESIRKLARDIGVWETDMTFTKAQTRIAEYFDSAARACLWIVDDLPQDAGPSEASKWLPSSSWCKTLVTTRGTQHALPGVIKLGPLDAVDAVALICCHREPYGEIEQNSVRKLVNELGCHPLAVDVAGAALKFEGLETSFEDYHKAIVRDASDHMEMAAQLAGSLPNGHEPSIVSTLMRSFDKLSDDGVQVLEVGACMSVAPIPYELFSAVLGQTSGEASTAKRRALIACKELSAYSLTDVSDNIHIGIKIHALVSKMIKAKSRERKDYEAGRLEFDVVKAAESILAANIPGDTVFDALYEHVEFLLGVVNGGSVFSGQVLQRALWRMGAGDRQIEWLRIALAKQLPEVKMGAYAGYLVLAERLWKALRQRSDFDAASQLMQDLDALGLSDSPTYKLMKLRMKDDEAVLTEEIEQAVEFVRSVDTISHGEAVRHNDIALSAQEQGRLDAAEEILRAILSKGESDKVTDAFVRYINLASVLIDQGKHFEEVFRLLSQAAEKMGKTPMACHVLVNFAVNFLNVDEPKLAEELGDLAIVKANDLSGQDDGAALLETCEALCVNFKEAKVVDIELKYLGALRDAIQQFSPEDVETLGTINDIECSALMKSFL